MSEKQDAATGQENVTEAINEESSRDGQTVQAAETAAKETRPEPEADHEEQQELKREASQEAPERDAKAESEPVPEDDIYGSLEKAEPEPAHGWGKIFDACSKTGPLIPFLAIACMVWPDFWRAATAWYCPGEMPSLTAFLHSIAINSWVAPIGLENGSWTAYQWPGFYWLLGVLALIPSVMEHDWLLPLGRLCAGLFTVIGVCAVSHTAKFGRKSAFTAAVMLLCMPLVTPLFHFTGPAPLAAALEMLAIACFCAGWQKKHSVICLPLAFIFTALAMLCGGLYLFIVPVCASILFLIWRGAFRRAQRLDAIFGFLLFLIIIGVWLGVVMLGNYGSYLPELYKGEWRFDWPPQKLWWIPLLIACVGSMPWLLTILGVSWIKVIGQAGQSLKASRTENGSAFIWLNLVVAACLSPFIATQHLAAILMACLMAVLLGKAFTRLAPAGNRFFCLLASLLLIVVGLVQLAVSFSFSQQLVLALFDKTGISLPVPDLPQILLSLNTLPIIGGIFVLGGLLALGFVRKYAQEGCLLYGLLLTVIICQPALTMLVPEIGAVPNSPLVHMAAIDEKVQAALGPSAAPLPEIVSSQPAPAPTEVIVIPDAAPEAVIAVPEPAPAQPAQAEEQPASQTPAAPEQAQEPAPAQENGAEAPADPVQQALDAAREASETATPPAQPAGEPANP